MDNSEDIVGYTGYALQAIIVLVLVITTFVTLKKVDFSIEKWAGALLTMYILSAVISLVSWIIYYSNELPYDIQHRDPLDCLQDFSEIFVFVMLYTFVFELKDLRVKLESDTPEIYQKRLGTLKMARFFAIFINATFSAANVGLSLYLALKEVSSPDKQPEYYIYTIISLVMTICLICLDILIGAQFIFIF